MGVVSTTSNPSTSGRSPDSPPFAEKWGNFQHITRNSTSKKEGEDQIDWRPHLQYCTLMQFKKNSPKVYYVPVERRHTDCKMSRDKITGVGVISIATHTHTRRLSFCLFLSFFQQQTCSKTVKVGHVVDPPVNWGPRSIQYIYNIQYISFFLSFFLPSLLFRHSLYPVSAVLYLPCSSTSVSAAADRPSI